MKAFLILLIIPLFCVAELTVTTIWADEIPFFVKMMLTGFVLGLAIGQGIGVWYMKVLNE